MTNSSETLEAITKYSSFVEEILKPQLQQSLENRDRVDEELKEYTELQQLVAHLEQEQQQMQKQSTVDHQPAQRHALKTLMDVGERFHVRTKIPDTSMIFVDVGLHFHVEMTLSEASAFCSRHLGQLNEKRAKCQEQVHEISQHVNVVLQAVEKLAMLESSTQNNTLQRS